MLSSHSGEQERTQQVRRPNKSVRPGLWYCTAKFQDIVSHNTLHPHTHLPQRLMSYDWSFAWYWMMVRTLKIRQIGISGSILRRT